ncbi:MAG: hypothetical protein K8R21_11000, partial [Leptospira sp.]|nr:hypothetical protein [Leptospira sp.]
MNTFTDEIPKFLPIGRTGNILFLENLTNPDIEKISDEVFFENQIPQWKKKDITGVYFFRSGSEKIMSGFPDHEKEIIFYDLSINEIDSEVYNEILRRHKNIIILFNEAVRGEVLLFCAKLFSLLDPLSDPEKIVGIIFGKELETETLALKKFAASNKRSILNNHFSANKIQRHPGMEKSATVPASLENKKTESTITPETNKDIGIPAVKLSEQSELKPEEQKASIEESKTKFGRRTSDRNSPEHPLFGDGAASKQESQIEQKAEDLPADTTTLGSDSPKWSLQIKMMGV